MPKILKLKGSEFTAPTSLGTANTALDSHLVKHYHSAAESTIVIVAAAE